jgi:hypothetical protein
MTERPNPADRLKNPEAVLSRRDLAELGYERRAIDAIFRGCPVVSLPGYSRPLICVGDFRAYLEEHTYRGDRVRPCRVAAVDGMIGAAVPGHRTFRATAPRRERR